MFLCRTMNYAMFNENNLLCLFVCIKSEYSEMSDLKNLFDIFTALQVIQCFCLLQPVNSFNEHFIQHFQ